MRILAAGALALLLCAACTPQTALLASVLPGGTVSVLLSHLQGEEDANRKQVAGLEAAGDWDGLAKFAEANLSRDRNNATWWFVSGYAHTQAGRHEPAIYAYREMVRLSPYDPMSWITLAQSYRDAKMPARAVQTLNNAHAVRNGTASTYFLLGESYFDLHRDLPAAAAYREAVALDAEFAQAWFGLGRSAARLNHVPDYERAMAVLGKLDPTRAKSLEEMRPQRR